VSINFWRNKGGCLSEQTIEKLRACGIEIEVLHHSNYKTAKHPVKMEYQDDIDIPDFKNLPTYKRMCICILKNDHLCKYMGFAMTKKEIENRKQIMDFYQSIYK
jgi:predicted phosphoadenosine phosphosulfate sulfurtransferase